MRPARTIQATWFAMLILQTIGSIDARKKLPAPKQYVAIGVTWGILFLIADIASGRAGRIASQLSILILLTSLIPSPQNPSVFGQRLLGWLQTISKNFAIPPATQAGASAPTTTAGPSGTVLA